MQRALILVLAGSSLGIGTLLPELWFLSLGSFALITYLVRDTHTPVTALWRQLFLIGTITYGFTFWAVFWHALPLDWLGLSGLVAIGLILLIWSLSTAVLAVSFASWLTAAAYLQTRNWFDVLLIPAAYVIADTVGTWLFGALHAGPSSLWGPHFTMSSPGYQLAESPIVLPITTLGGLYGLLFVQAAVGVFIYTQYRRYTQTGQQTRMIGIALLLLLIYFTPQGAPDTPQPLPLHIAAITTYETSGRGTPVTDEHARITKQVSQLPTTTELVFLPEDVRYIQKSRTMPQQYPAATTSAWLIDSGTLRTDSGLQSRITMWQPPTPHTATSSKKFLMVFGEYMPYLYTYLGRALGLDEVLTRLQTDRAYQTTPGHLFSYNQLPFSVMLCSDAMSPTLYANEVRAGATFIVNLASHGWHHQSRALYHTAVRVGQVRATESHRWYIRASNDTPSFVIAPNGMLTHETVWYDTTPLLATIYPHTKTTPFTIMQHWVLLAPTVILLYAAWRKYSYCAKVLQDE